MNVSYSPPPGPPPTQHPLYAPPPGPPPSHSNDYGIAAFNPTVFPLLSPAQAHSLSTRGFTSLPISSHPALFEAATTLFDISRSFFAQPQPYKSQFQVHFENAQGSEEGWSRVVGEKELLTLRRGGAAACPPSVENEARSLWQECGTFMKEVMHAVERSLGLSPGVFDGLVSAECVMPQEGAERHETLLRMFRYERCVEDDDVGKGKGRLVSASHHDLGLLSLVIGASPGLEVLDTTTNAWIPIEEPPHAHPGTLTATLLVGETLTRLTNARYAPGRHRVFIPQSSDPFRYSLVFALRPHAHALISTAELTSPITGPFLYPLEGVQARVFFAAISRMRWNVNARVEIREAQRTTMKVGAGKLDERENVESKKSRWSLRFRSLLRNGNERNRLSILGGS